MPQPLLIAYLFVLGVSIGSFLNVLIDRLPKDRKITGRSSCDFCHRKLTWLDLIPVFSFILLGGACRYCKKKISYYYPIVEIITGIFFILTWFFIQPSIFYLGIISLIIVIFFTDWKYQIIPDQIQIAFFLFALAIFITNGLSAREILYHLWEGFVVLAPILAIYFLTKGKGMGFGDVKLAFVIGFFLGIKQGLTVLYLAFILGALIGIVLIVLKKKKLKSKIAFGPFLTIGILILLFFKNAIGEMVFRIFGF